MEKRDGHRRLLGYVGHEKRLLGPLAEEEVFPHDIVGEFHVEGLPTLDELDADPQHATNPSYMAFKRRLGL